MWIKCQILFGICCQFHFNFHFGLFSAHNFWEFSSRYTLPLSAKGSCTWFDIVRFQGWHVRPPIEMWGCICLNSEINLSIFLYLSSCTWFDIVRFESWHVRPPIGCICLNFEFYLSIFRFVFVFLHLIWHCKISRLTWQVAHWNVRLYLSKLWILFVYILICICLYFYLYLSIFWIVFVFLQLIWHVRQPIEMSHNISFPP